ncbi:aprataxin and PNK-like factor isoform X4 [Gambusia affinis]|uniref:aprataxin and PNK-like factor isoform X4 n=1 Tax=Gambusia affinis TaxID=33528 RepID=UPI001CDD3279|nr:aprataxin and PNK-like factor isoform X4 [Gambusia affinis]
MAQRSSYITSSQQTHINPCFLLLSPNDDPRPLERGSWHRLQPGDQFSLLPGRFIYRVAAYGAEQSAPRNSQNFEEEDGALPLPAGSDAAAPLAARPGQEQTSCPDRNQHSSDFRQEVSTPRLDGVQSDEAPPPPRRRVLPAWMMAAAAAPASKGVKRSKPAATPDPPTLSPPPEEAELREEDAETPRKKSRAMSSEEEILPTQTDDLWDESTSRGQIGPSRSEVSSSPSRSAAAEKSQQEEKKIRSGVRTACPYGKDCYSICCLLLQEEPASLPGEQSPWRRRLRGRGGGGGGGRGGATGVSVRRRLLQEESSPPEAVQTHAATRAPLRRQRRPRQLHQRRLGRRLGLRSAGRPAAAEGGEGLPEEEEVEEDRVT